jgi:protein-tyrosine phosphatase
MIVAPPELHGVSNFRDFGGYPTRMGGAIARGRLFRSGHFGDVTAQDGRRLDGLGIEFLVDLRHPVEFAARPNRWSPGRVLARDPDEDAGAGGLPAATEPGPYTAAVGRAIMRATYARIPFDPWFVALLGDLLGSLAETGGPMIVHCSVGKDRTGIACALILDTLGVGRGDIAQDYLATNAALDRTERARLARADLEPLHGPLDDATIEPVMGVEASYLQTAIAAIEDRHGTMASYIEDILGVTPAVPARLCAHLVGPDR